MVSALGRSLESVLKNIDVSQDIPISEDVPIEPYKFYSFFGYLRHPITKKPVLQLTDYQLEVWNALLEYKRVLAIKGQKIGLSTSQLIADFQLAILPSKLSLSCRGYDQLLLAQTVQHAKEHLRTLRKLIIESKYANYLIDRPVDLEQDDISLKRLIRDEQTKQSVLFIRNPDNERQPSRIIALGLDNAGAIQSWKNVKHIHISDPTAAIGDVSEALGYAISRLANTDGSMVIETPPSPPQGPIYDLWLKYRAKTKLKPGDFKVFEIPADRAVAAGVMTREHLDSERERDPVNFERLYLAKFTAHFGNVFSSTVIEKAIELGKRYDPDKVNQSAEKSQGIDEGFGSSKFGIVVVQRIDDILQVILADEHERPSIDDEIYDAAARIKSWNISSTQCDAAQPAFIAGLKRKVGENPHYETVPKESHRWMKVRPIPFGTTHKAMLGNTLILLEKGKVAIHPRFDKLLTSLRTAIAQDYSLDKDATVNNDVLDAFRLALEPFHIGDR